MLVVGLTGGIGSGKSAAGRAFEALGVPVIDTDQIARDVVAPGQPGLEALAGAFGPDIIKDGGLDRARLRTLAFADAGVRRRLEAILHPLIRTELRERLSLLTAPYCVVAVPLLFETDFREAVDRILVVESPLSLRIERVVARDDTDRASVQRIVDAQATDAQRRAGADDLLVNDGDLDTLALRVADLHARYLALARTAG